MFTRTTIEAKLDKEIIDSLDELSNWPEESENYGVIVERVSKLYKLKSEERRKLPSPDTVLLVAANIFGVLWLTHYERENVITSKAFNFAMKPR